MKKSTKLGCLSIFCLLGVGIVIPSVSKQIEVGFVETGVAIALEISTTVTNIKGDCPGEEKSEPEVFFRGKIQPASGLRVRIENPSAAKGDSIPFTDREYNKGKLSEPTRLVLGSGHSGNRFRFTEGDNNLTYEIYRGGKDNKQVVESGQFSFQAKVKEKEKTRDADWKDELFCLSDRNLDYNDKKCDVPAQRHVGYCPGDLPSHPKYEEDVRRLDRKHGDPKIIIYP
jgi:hypothetical protein